jgi:predicted naringenin-chalcone synthase
MAGRGDEMHVYWLAFSTGNPPHFFPQQQIFRMARYDRFPREIARKAQCVFKMAGVARRSMWLPREDYEPSCDPDDFHRRYRDGLAALAPRVAAEALLRAGLGGEDVDFVVFASCTGYTCPGYSVELAHALGVPEGRPTANLLGMGCTALVPALRAAWDHLRSEPGSRALVVAAEICSATYWIDDDLEAAVGNALFGDGAAAIVLSSREDDLERGREAMARIEGFRTLRDGRALSAMGFTQRGGRLRVRLASEIPETIVPLAVRMAKALELEDGARVAFHPGGRKILDLLEQDLPPGWEAPIGWSRAVLRDFGNMSSPTAAFVLKRSFEERPLQTGERGAIFTMGPGISVEAMKMRWL